MIAKTVQQPEKVPGLLEQASIAARPSDFRLEQQTLPNNELAVEVQNLNLEDAVGRRAPSRAQWAPRPRSL
ncbi:MAG TPA: hypothetical protein VNX18_11935 [Bryobacteraceae bacterium]|jgi:hypothetical protein|nr:hypothetical protein [Bryobacteraceae bacterium]